MQVLIVNGEPKNNLSQQSFQIENISKGGFRFIADTRFELEDRVQVLLVFPDGPVKEVFGRICYLDTLDDSQTAYGFSILKGFYSL